MLVSLVRFQSSAPFTRPSEKALVLAIVIWYFRGMAAAAFAQSREIEYQPIVPRRRQSRRFFSHAMLFVAAVLAVNGLIGERGLLQTLRARRAYAAAAADVERLRQANEALRD